MKHKIFRFLYIFCSFLFLMTLSGCVSTSERCISSGYIKRSDCQLQMCEEQGYISSEDVNVLINLTNDLINMTNDCTGNKIPSLKYFTAS